MNFIVDKILKYMVNHMVNWLVVMSQTIIKNYQFKLSQHTELNYFRYLIDNASRQLLDKLWSELWIRKLGTESKKKAWAVINEKQVELILNNTQIYLPSRIRRGIAERVGRILRSQYKRMNCYYDCLKILEVVDIKSPINKLIKMVTQTLRNKKGFPLYKKVMIEQTIRMIKSWHKKLAYDKQMLSYCQLVKPHLNKFMFPYSVTENHVLKYKIVGNKIHLKIRLPVNQQSVSISDWKWFSKEITIPKKLLIKISKSTQLQPKKPRVILRRLKGGLEYYFIQFPWEFNSKNVSATERVLAVDLGLKKFATAVVCELTKQISKPYTICMKGSQYLHIERLYKNIANIQRKLARANNLSNKMKSEEECQRLYAKRNRIGEELAHLGTNLLIKIALQWNCTKIVIEDLRNLTPPRGKNHWSRRLSYWLRGKVVSLLDYKCQEKGLILQKVCPWNTSSYCPRCTQKGQKVVSSTNHSEKSDGRWFYCPHCGFSADRDYIASINIYRASFIDYKVIKSLKNISPISYTDIGNLYPSVLGGVPDMNQNGLIMVTGG